MKTAFGILFFLTLILPTFATEEESSNQSEVERLMDNLGDGEGGDIYWTASFSPITLDSLMGENSFIVTDGGKIRTGTIPLDTSHIFGNSTIAVGGQIEFENGLKFRHQYGLRWLSLNMGTPTYERFDFAPADIDTINSITSIDGDIDVNWFPQFGGYLDIPLGSDSDDYIYLGASIGWMNTDVQYDLNVGSYSVSLDDSDWVRSRTIEAGVIVGLRERLKLQFGYEWSQFGDVDLVARDGSKLNFMAGNRQTIKFSILHWFLKN